MSTISINEKFLQPAIYRNDIFRKFEMQFSTCFLNNINIGGNLYIDQSTDEYSKALNVFVSALNSDIKFFIGYTGVGKTTFLKHFFGYRTMGCTTFRKNAIVIPASWDGRKIADDNFKEEIKSQISNILDNLVKYLYHDYEYLILHESEEIVDFIDKTRSDVLTTLSIQEIKEAEQIGITLSQAKLQKSKNLLPVEFSSSLLKYVIDKHCQDVTRLIFVVDDLETLAQNKLCYLVTTYLTIYDCLHNTVNAPIVNLLFSMRPHSFRFLQNNIDHKFINVYGNFLQNEKSRILKNQIPNIRDILIARFDDVFAKTEKPGNPETWRIAKKKFYEIIASLDDNIVKTVTEVCHLNIRAIIDCFYMILSNRVWCQSYTEYSEYPTVRDNDYRFDIVNVVRTIACGENSVYTGKKDLLFNQQNTSNVMARPRFDDSDIFIPNILINLDTRECDVLTSIVMQYLENYFSSKTSTPPQTEFISKETLCKNIGKVFGDSVDIGRIESTVDFLFRNRIIRKSIISKDSDSTINKLEKEDYVYLTLKGSRLLAMFESDSVLLEIYREDIKRNYNREKLVYKSSLELVSENKRHELFEDLINLIEEVYYSEDSYQTHVIETETASFYERNFPISNRLIRGVEKSLHRSQNINQGTQRILLNQLDYLKKKINQRYLEIGTASDYAVV